MLQKKAKGFVFYGITFDLCRFCTYLNSAKLAGWAKFKNVQNVSIVKYEATKNKPFKLWGVFGIDILQFVAYLTITSLKCFVLANY